MQESTELKATSSWWTAHMCTKGVAIKNAYLESKPRQGQGPTANRDERVKSLVVRVHCSPQTCGSSDGLEQRNNTF